MRRERSFGGLKKLRSDRSGRLKQLGSDRFYCLRAIVFGDYHYSRKAIERNRKLFGRLDSGAIGLG